MNKTLIKLPASKDTVKYRVIIESEECEWNTAKGRYVQFELLQYIANDPSITSCGYHDFKVLVMKHDGARWRVEAEAEVPEPPTP